MDYTSDKSTDGIFLLHFHFPEPRKYSTNAHTAAAADLVVYREMTVDDKIPNAHFHILEVMQLDVYHSFNLLVLFG